MNRLLLAFALLLGACAHAVQPEDMSAAQHRAEAQRENAAAAEHLQKFDPQAVQVMHQSRVGPEGVIVASDSFVSYNPTEGQLHEAQRHSAHARAHEAAAAQLESFEQAECGEFRPSVRAACPVLGPVERTEELADGVRFYLGAGVDVRAVLAHMRCHLAYARARGFPGDCPLYLKGVEIRADGEGAVAIVSSDRKVAAEIQRRAR